MALDSPHRVLAQLLYGTGMRIMEGVRLRVNSALETVTLAIESSKRIMHNLRPAILEQGLVAALQWIASRFEKRTGIACELRLPTQTPAWPAGVPLVAYRTAL